MNKRSQVQIVWGHKTPKIEQKLQDIVPWVREAGRPYFDILLRGSDLDSTLRGWIQRNTSELSTHRMRLMIRDDRICGGYIALAGQELAGCRQADLLDLARDSGAHSYGELRARMEDLRDLFAPVEENDFYLSKIGVMEGGRWQGLSHQLMEDCIWRARQGGFRRVRVDVPERGAAARELDRGYGFEAIYRGRARQSNLRYLSLALDL